MLRHLHQMVPATGPVKRKRKAEHHRHNSSTSLCKKPAPPRHDLDVTFDRACSIHGRVSPTDIAATATTVDSPRQGDVNGSIFHRAGDHLCFVAVGEETTSTDDESELSSTDGRSSPSHSHPAVSWGPASSNQGATGFVPDCFQAPLGVGYVTPRAIGVAMETPLAATAAVSTRGRKVCSSSSGGKSTGASCVYGVGAPIDHQYQQQQQQQYQQQLEKIYEEEQQHLQGHGTIQQQVVRDGGRADADVWGWFVDAGDELQPSRANNSVQNGGVGVRYY